MTSRMLHPAALLAGTFLLGSVAHGEGLWNSIHLDSSHNAVRDGRAVITDLATLPPLEVPGQGLREGARLIEVPGGLLAVRFESGEGGPVARVVRYSTAMLPGTLGPEYVSPPMAAGVSDSFGSVAVPSVNESRGEYYFSVGEAVHILRPDADGIVTVALDGDSTVPGASNTIINSSVALSADGTIGFVKTFLGFGSPQQSQLVAVDLVAAEVLWSVVTGGPGQVTPLVVNVGGLGEIVVVDASDNEGRGGLAAFRATDGTPLWNHATIASPWHTGFTQFYADLVFDQGRVYGLTYDFSANGLLAIVDAATGVATTVTAPGTDIAPVVLDGVAVVVGGGYGAAEIAGYDALDGAQRYRRPLAGGGKFVFRNYLAAHGNALLVPTSNGFGMDPNPALYLVDPANGAVLSATPSDRAFSGTTTLLADGSIATIGNGGSLRVFRAANVVQPFNYVYLAPIETDLLGFDEEFLAPSPGEGDGIAFTPEVSLLRNGDLLGIGTITETFAGPPSSMSTSVIPLRGRLRGNTRIDVRAVDSGDSPVDLRDYSHRVRNQLRLRGRASFPGGNYRVDLAANARHAGEVVASDIPWADLLSPVHGYRLTLRTPEGRTRTEGTTRIASQGIHALRADAATLETANPAGNRFTVVVDASPTLEFSTVPGIFLADLSVNLRPEAQDRPGRFSLRSDLVEGCFRANGLTEAPRETVQADPAALLSAPQPSLQYQTRSGAVNFRYRQR